MTRIRKAGPPVVVIAVIAGIVGYIFGCTNSAREENAQASAAQNDPAQEGETEVDTATEADVVAQNDIFLEQHIG